VVLVAGEAGVGKTRLVSEFVNRCEGGRVLIGSCVPVADGGLPYAPITQALRHLNGELNARAGGHLVDASQGEFARWLFWMSEPDQVERGGETGNELAQTRLFEFLLGLLGELGRGGPVLLVVEDVHWADRSTLDFLTFLMRNLQREPVVVVVTYRDDELHRAHPLRPWLAELRRSTKVEHIRLKRLNRHETSEQLAAILGSTPNAEVVDCIFARSEGNAFFTEELASTLFASSDRALPVGLRDTLLAKVHSLSKPGQEVLGVAAAAGRHVSHELLSFVAQMPEDQLTVALREVVDHHVLMVDLESGLYRFRHALIQEVTYRDLLPGERRRLHRALAETLAKNAELATPGASAQAELAHHWYAAGDLPATFRATVAAARAAEAVYGFAEASRHFERALELWDQVPDPQQLVNLDRVDMLERTAEIAKLLAEYDRAVARINEALELVDAETEPVRVGLLYERLGWYHLNRGDDQAAADAYERALSLIPPEPPSAARAKGLIAASRLSMFLAHYEQAHAEASEALALARAIGVRAYEGQALRTLGIVIANKGDFETGIRHLRQAVSIAEEIRDIGSLPGGYIDLSYQLGVAGRLEEAVQVALDGYQVISRLRLERVYGPMLEANAASALFELGRWEQATTLVASAERRRPSGITEMIVLAEALKLTVARGDFARAREQLDRAATLCRNVLTPLYQRQMLEPSAELAIWQGRLDDADRAVGEALKLCAQSDEQRFTGRLFMLGLRAQADRAELAGARRAGAGEARAAGAALREQASGLAANPLDPAASPLPETPAIAATCEAENSRLEGRSDSQLWATAAARWDELGRPYPAAYARWRQAEALAAAGRRREGGEVLRRAHEVARRLGAQPLCHELELLARRARIDLQEPVPETEAAQEPDQAERIGLTPREIEVLKHVAIGRSNRQIARTLFISEKTVSVHVSRILHKLGAQSRVEAAGIAYRLGLGDPPGTD
jgi:DNA-binding CsgD family transcriptional regulator